MRQATILAFLFLIFIANFSRAQTPNGTIDINGPDTVCTGSSGFMTLLNASSSPAFWQVTTNGGINWSTINNSNTVNSFFMAANDLCYRAVLVNGDTSAITCLVVDDSSSAGSVAGGAEFCSLANGTLLANATVGNSLGWFSSINNGLTFLPVGNISTTHNFTNLSQSTVFAFLVKNGVCPIDTAFDTVFVSPLSNSGLLIGTDTVCSSGNQGLLQLTNFTGEILSWQESNNGGISWLNIANTNDSLSYQNLSQVTSYQVIVQSGTCPPDTSNEISITVDSAPASGQISGGGYFCGPPASGVLSLGSFTGNPVWLQSSNNGVTWSPSACVGSSCNFSGVTGTQLYQVMFSSILGACPAVYSAIDTIQHSPASVSGTITASNDTICAQSGSVVFNLNGQTGATIIWQASIDDGVTWTNLSQFTGNTAFLTGLPSDVVVRAVVQNNQCPNDTTNFQEIVVTPSPTVNILTSDTTVNQGDSLLVIANGTGSPVWYPLSGVSNATSFVTSILPSSSGYYFINVSNVSGCSTTDSIFITVNITQQQGFISNAITPNGDGVNDEFFVEGILLNDKNKLSIFNEYGQLVFYASPYKNDWKGIFNSSRLPDGTYYYVLEYTDDKKIVKGFITLLSQK